MATPNLFNYATSELSQDAFILWLLAWANPMEDLDHDQKHLQDASIAFVKLLLGIDEPITSVECKKQEDHIDVLAIVNKKYALIIEDKTDTAEHDEQLQRYSNLVNKNPEYKDLELHCVYFKTGNESKHKLNRLAKRYKKNNPTAHFSVILRSDILNVLSTEKFPTHNAIFVDYVKHIEKIERTTQSYQKKVMADWGSRAWQGFFLELEDKLGEGDWAYVNNPSGGFWGFWWNSVEVSSDIKLYFQIEQSRICIKAISKGTCRPKSDWTKKLISVAKGYNIKISRPQKLKIGKTMTLAILDVDAFTANSFINMPSLVEELNALNTFLPNAAKALL